MEIINISLYLLGKIQTKKDFELDTPEKFTYLNWRKWDKSSENFLYEKLNLRLVPLSYVIRSYEVP